MMVIILWSLVGAGLGHGVLQFRAAAIAVLWFFLILRRFSTPPPPDEGASAVPR